MSPTSPVFALPRLQAARAIGVCPTTLDELTESGKLGKVKIGRAVLIPVEDIRTLLETHRVRPEPVTA